MPKPVVNILFSANIKQFSTEMENVSRSLKRTGRQLERTGKSLSRNLTAPIAALGVAAVATFASFQQEMAKVKAISGATGSEFQALKKNAEDLGAATRFSSEAVAGLQLNLSKLGLSPDEILAATQATLNLAQATGEDLANSATVAASTIRGFQLDASETGRVTDVMAKSFSSSALDLEKFKVAMATVAPVANTAGQSIEDTTGFLSVLVNAGVDASTAGTGLRNIFLDVAKSGGTLEGALSEIATSSNKNATAMALFGKRGATVATVLADNIDQAKGFADEYRNAGGEAARMAAIMDGTLAGSLARLKSATEGAAIAFGEEMAPTINSVIEVITDAISGFKELSPETKKFIIVAGGIAAAIGPAILVVGSLLRNLSAIIPVMRALSLVIAANPIGALAVGIGLVVGALVAFNSNTERAVRAQSALVRVNEEAQKSIAGERAELSELLSFARDEQLSKELRLKAIRDLNRLSPAYLGNLTLEKINTDDARKAIDLYNESLLRTAKAKAAQNKLQELQSKIIDAEIAQSKSRTALGAASVSASQDNVSGLSSEVDATKELILAKRSENDQIILGTNKRGELVTSQSRLNGIALSSIAIGDKKIAKLKEEEQAILDIIKANATPPTPTSGGGGVTPPTPTSVGGDSVDFDDLDLEFGSLEELNQALIDTGANLDLALSEASVARFEQHLERVASAYADTNDAIDPEVQRFLDAQERMKAVSEAVGNAVGSAFSAIGGKISQGLGAAEGGLRGFIGTLAETATQLIAIMLSQSIASSIAGATVSGTATGPAAVISTPAFIATAVGGVLSAFAAIPQFETGGIVGGASYTGDKILARVNSGELILNQAQQDGLYEQLNTSGVMEVTGQLRARGDDLIAVLDRKRERNRSIGGNGA